MKARFFFLVFVNEKKNVYMMYLIYRLLLATERYDLTIKLDKCLWFGYKCNFWKLIMKRVIS